MFDTFETLNTIIQITSGIVQTLQVFKALTISLQKQVLIKPFQVNVAQCTRALSTDMLATDLAYYLVRKGVSFKHRVIRC